MGDAVNAGEAGKIDVAAITKSVTEAVTKTVIETLQPKLSAIDELAKNQKVIADTIAQLPPAKKEEKADVDQKAAPVTADAVAKIVADAIAADRKSQADESGKNAARKAFLESDKSGLKKLPTAYQDKLGTDPAKFETEAASIVSEWQKFAKDNGVVIPDVGGATREGGETPAGAKAPANSKYSFIKMPDGVGTPPTAAIAAVTAAAAAATK